MNTRKKPPFALIFDMDGVLVDTSELNWQLFQELLSPYGVTFTQDDIREGLGASILSKVALWNKKYNLNLSFDKFIKDFELAKKQKKYDKQIKIRPSLISLLADLHSNGVPMGVGTSSMKERAEKLLVDTDIKKFFTVLITAEDVQEHKPSPHVFLAVAKALDVSPDRCFVIEDALNGIEAAKRGGMKAIGYHNGFNNFEAFDKADMIIDDFSELSFEKLRETL